MRIWLALLAAPSLALACQAVLYALVTPSCNVQTRVVLHVVAGASLVLTLWFALLARGAWAMHAGGTGEGLDADHGDPRTARAFLSMMGVAVAVLSSLAILAMWVAVWVLSPCW